jgi:hypothetical protein
MTQLRNAYELKRVVDKTSVRRRQRVIKNQVKRLNLWRVNEANSRESLYLNTLDIAQIPLYSMKRLDFYAVPIVQ